MPMEMRHMRWIIMDEISQVEATLFARADNFYAPDIVERLQKTRQKHVAALSLRLLSPLPDHGEYRQYDERACEPYYRPVVHGVVFASRRR